jgi:hypothetical protein
MTGPRTGFLELKTLPQVCKSICLPADQGPVRLPTYPAVERTSVLALNATTTINVPAAGRRGILFRHSTMPLWLESDIGVKYAWSAVWSLAGGNHGDFDVGLAPYLVTAGNFGPVDGCSISGSADFPGPCPMGELDSLPAIYVAKRCQVEFLIRGSAVGGNTARLTLRITNYGGGIQQVTVNATSSAYGWYAIYTVNETCFIAPTRLDCFGSAATPISVFAVSHNGAIGVTGTPGLTGSVNVLLTDFNPLADATVMLPTLTAPAQDISIVPFSNTRTTACAALFTNVTKALNKEGTIMAGRFNPQVQNVFDVGPIEYSNLTPMEKYFYGLEGGFYTYTPLSTNVEEFSNDIHTKLPVFIALTPSFPILHLGRNSMVNCFQFSDPDGGTALAVNLDWHVEFRNSSVLWPVGISAMSLEQAHQAQLVLLETGCFFDNINHQKILGYVTSALKTVKPYLDKTAIGAAVYGGATMAAKAYARYVTPKPSTLQAAMPKPKVKKPKEKKVKVKMPPPKPKKDKKKK